MCSETALCSLALATMQEMQCRRTTSGSQARRQALAVTNKQRQVQKWQPPVRVRQARGRLVFNSMLHATRRRWKNTLWVDQKRSCVDSSLHSLRLRACS